MQLHTPAYYCFNPTGLDPPGIWTHSILYNFHKNVHVDVALFGIFLEKENFNFHQKSRIQSPILQFYTRLMTSRIFQQTNLWLRTFFNLFLLHSPHIPGDERCGTQSCGCITASVAPSCCQAGWVRAVGEFLKTLPLPANHRLNKIPGSHIKIAHSAHNKCILHSIFPCDHVKAGERGALMEKDRCGLNNCS